MNNFDYKYARYRKDKERRKKRWSILSAAGLGLFVCYVIASTMSYNDCLQGIC